MCVGRASWQGDAAKEREAFLRARVQGIGLMADIGVVLSQCVTRITMNT